MVGLEWVRGGGYSHVLVGNCQVCLANWGGGAFELEIGGYWGFGCGAKGGSSPAN